MSWENLNHYYYADKDLKLYQGDTLDILKELPSDFVDCVITSPPYYGLRTYVVDGQIGLEKTFQEFMQKILAVTAEIKRVLKPTGSFWLNFGDCYGGNPTGSMPNPNSSFRSLRTQQAQMQAMEVRKLVEATDNDRMYKSASGRLKQTAMSKCLLMQPERLALKMIDEQGWILRNKIKWVKQIYIYKQRKTMGSVMPSSVKDRFNESGEELYFFVKNKRYYFDLDAVRIPNQVLGVTDFRASGLVRSAELYPNSKYANAEGQGKIDGRVKNHKGIWRLNGFEREKVNFAPADHRGENDKTEKNYGLKDYQGKFKGNPNAEMFNSPRARTQRNKVNDPRGSHEGGPGSWRDNLDNQEYRKNWKGKREYRGRWGNDGNGMIMPNKYNSSQGKNLPSCWLIQSEPHNFQKELKATCDHFAAYPQALCEIPIKAGCPKDGIVLDPFCGSGTTGIMAQKLGRKFIGIDLSEKYLKEIAIPRLQKEKVLL